MITLKKYYMVKTERHGPEADLLYDDVFVTNLGNEMADNLNLESIGLSF